MGSLLYLVTRKSSFPGTSSILSLQNSLYLPFVEVYTARHMHRFLN